MDVKAPDVGGSFVDLNLLTEDEKSLLGRFIYAVHKSCAHFTWKSGHGLDVQTYREAACLIQRLLCDHIPQWVCPALWQNLFTTRRLPPQKSRLRLIMSKS
jgi:hypothetical protein